MSIKICPVCKEPLERDIKIGNETIRLRRRCSCELEERKREEECYEIARKAERARDIIYDGYLNIKFAEPSFSKDDCANSAMSERLLRYCDKWEEIKRKNIGLYLFGNTGSGKTFYASAIANRIRREVNDYVLIGSASSFIQETFGDFGKGRKLMEYKITHYPLMVIDDLGTENQSDFNLSAIEQIIDLRLGARLPLIVTSNFSPKDLYLDGGLLGERIKSRLSEMCVPLLVRASDRRKGKAMERNEND